MKWDEARGHVDAFWRRNQHSRYQIIYIYKYTFWILFGNKFFHHVRTIDNIYASKWSRTAKANFKPICISKKKARRFLEIFETSEKILKPALNNVKFSHPRRWILKGFMHSELYVGRRVDVETHHFLHMARPYPEISYSNWNNAGGFFDQERSGDGSKI